MMRPFNVFAVSLVSLSLAACASMSFPLEGVVIDSDTGKPLPGAFVIVQTTFYGADPVGARTTCPYVAVAQADADGRFRMADAGAPGFGNVDRVVFGYKAGYEWDGEKQSRDRVVAMREFKGTTKERVESFRTFGSLRGCGRGEEKITTLRPLYEALDRELADLHSKGPVGLPLGTYTRSLQWLEEDAQAAKEFKERRNQQ